MQSSTLTEHERIHRNSRPYECQICHKTFIQNGSLVNHLKIHTNSKEFKCKICEKSFNRAETLQKHIKNHERVSTKERNDCANLMGELLKESRLTECQESTELPLQLLESEEVEQEIETPVLVKMEEIEESIVVSEQERKSLVMPKVVDQNPEFDKSPQKTEKISTKVEQKMECDICGSKMKFSVKNFVKHYRTKHFQVKKSQKMSKKINCKISNKPLEIVRIHTKERIFKCAICKYNISSFCY